MTEILLEIYEEYNESKTITKLEEFTAKTFPQDGTDQLFIACVLILINSVYKSRLSGETLATVVQLAKEKVDDIITASENLLEIVNGILDISKIEANKLEIIKKEYEPAAMLQELVSLTKVMSVVVVINAFAIVQRARTTKAIDFKTQTKITFISSIGSGAIGIAMAYMGYGVWALVGQQISNQLFSTIFFWIYKMRICRDIYIQYRM